MEHDLTEARKNARTDADAAAIAWAQDEIERLRKIEDAAFNAVNARLGDKDDWLNDLRRALVRIDSK